ncbi:hypothetical protein M918_05980 [Clostridium sp. BL8]|nr:hypothetical protein M918_05980 [Clostridium sp. BL8]
MTIKENTKLNKVEKEGGINGVVKRWRIDELNTTRDMDIN